MKKKKYILVLIVIISSFCFMNNVSADLASEAKKKSCEQLIEEGLLDKNNKSIIFNKGDLEVNCGYIRTYEYTSWFSTKEACAILQVAFNKDGSKFKYESIGTRTGTQLYIYKGINSDGKKDGMTLDSQYFSQLEGTCPLQVNFASAAEFDKELQNIEQFSFDFLNQNMERIFVDGAVEIDVPPLIIINPDKEPESCKDILGEDAIKTIRTIKNLLIMVVPIILIALGIIDFVQAIFANDENVMKKAQTKFLKRVIIAVIILLIPTILQFILKMANMIWPSIDYSLCGILD